MKHTTVEVFVDSSDKTLLCFKSCPAYGDSPEPARGFKQRYVLSDGQHRVKIAIFNATLPLEHIKAIARVAVGANDE